MPILPCESMNKEFRCIEKKVTWYDKFCLAFANNELRLLTVQASLEGNVSFQYLLFICLLRLFEFFDKRSRKCPAIIVLRPVFQLAFGALCLCFVLVHGVAIHFFDVVHNGIKLANRNHREVWLHGCVSACQSERRSACTVKILFTKASLRQLCEMYWLASTVPWLGG